MQAGLFLDPVVQERVVVLRHHLLCIKCWLVVRLGAMVGSWSYCPIGLGFVDDGLPCQSFHTHLHLVSPHFILCV